MNSRTGSALLLLVVASILLVPATPPARGLITICDTNTGSPTSDSWTPRPGATVTITAHACGTKDPSTGLFQSTMHSVSSSTTDPTNLIALSGNYTFEAFCSTNFCHEQYSYLQTTLTGSGVYPNTSQSFSLNAHKESKEAITDAFNLVVKDQVSGTVHTLLTAAFACTSTNCPA